MAAKFGQLVIRRMFEIGEINSIEELPKIITLAMEMAEKVENYSGLQKKQLVIDATIYVVSKMDPQNAAIWDDCLIATLPYMIDHFLTVADKGLQINMPTTKRQFRCPCPEIFVNYFRSTRLEEK